MPYLFQRSFDFCSARARTFITTIQHDLTRLRVTCFGRSYDHFQKTSCLVLFGGIWA
jgi:hypothetical protein